MTTIKTDQGTYVIPLPIVRTKFSSCAGDNILHVILQAENNTQRFDYRATLSDLYDRAATSLAVPERMVRVTLTMHQSSELDEMKG